MYIFKGNYQDYPYLFCHQTWEGSIKKKQQITNIISSDFSSTDETLWYFNHNRFIEDNKRYIYNKVDSRTGSSKEITVLDVVFDILLCNIGTEKIQQSVDNYLGKPKKEITPDIPVKKRIKNITKEYRSQAGKNLQYPQFSNTILSSLYPHICNRLKWEKIDDTLLFKLVTWYTIVSISNEVQQLQPIFTGKKEYDISNTMLQNFVKLLELQNPTYLPPYVYNILYYSSTNQLPAPKSSIYEKICNLEKHEIDYGLTDDTKQSILANEHISEKTKSAILLFQI